MNELDSSNSLLRIIWKIRSNVDFFSITKILEINRKRENEIRSDHIRYHVSILVITLEINYQLGRKFTNHNNGRWSIIETESIIGDVFHRWIKSMREIEPRSFQRRTSLASGISNNRERSRRQWFTRYIGQKIGYRLLLLWRERGEGSFRHPSTGRGNNINPTLAGCTMHILRYIIFIIRARDTRSRAWVYNTPESVNRI